MSDDIKPWMVISKTADKGPEDEGLILCCDESSSSYWWIPMPQPDKHRRRVKHHIKAPRRDSIEYLQQRVDSKEIQLRPFQPMGMQALTVRVIEEMAASATGSRARNLKESLARMRQQWTWIEPYVKRAGAGMDALLDVDAVAAYARSVSPKLGVSTHRIVRALRAYLLGGMRIEALLPAWDRSGAPGKPRLPRCDETGAYSRRPGRRNPAYRRGMSAHLGVVSTEDVRTKLRMGYREFKKSKRIPVETAFALTLGKYWAEHVEVTESGRKITLQPLEKLPTIDQFRRHGPGTNAAMSARRINIGEHAWERDHRALFGSERDKLRAAGQCATIDSTSDDQNLVLSVDRNIAMPVSWNTKLRDTYTGYIAGFYSGFEPPSTMTSLIAIAMAADSKAEFCKRYGITISEDEWLPLYFRRIRADNGELKSEQGVAAMAESEITAEFVKAYAAERKGGVESTHFQHQIGAAHQLPGSTQGRQRKRGESDPAKDACLTHYEYMGHAIRWILYYNNVQRVEHLLTLEMRRDKVEPTRGAILKWLIKNGYVVTDSPIQSTIRASCLPRIRGSLTRDGIRIFDPGTKDNRHIPGLLYNSAALIETGLTNQGRSFSQEVWVHMNPADIGRVWLSYRGLVEVELQTHDPELKTLPLREWLQIADEDRLERYLTRPHRLQILTNDGMARYDSKASATKKNAQKASAPACSGALPRRMSKPEAAAIETEQQRMQALGLDMPDPRSEDPQWLRAAEEVESANEPAWVIQARAAANLE